MAFYIVWPSLESFESTEVPLPSGQLLGDPRVDVNGRRLARYNWDQLTQEDVDYFLSMEGVTVSAYPPDPWDEYAEE